MFWPFDSIHSFKRSMCVTRTFSSNILRGLARALALKSTIWHNSSRDKYDAYEEEEICLCITFTSFRPCDSMQNTARWPIFEWRSTAQIKEVQQFLI